MKSLIFPVQLILTHTELYDEKINETYSYL